MKAALRTLALASLLLASAPAFARGGAEMGGHSPILGTNQTHLPTTNQDRTGTNTKMTGIFGGFKQKLIMELENRATAIHQKLRWGNANAPQLQREFNRIVVELKLLGVRPELPE
jgi:hypothetical protein